MFSWNRSQINLTVSELYSGDVTCQEKSTDYLYSRNLNTRRNRNYENINYETSDTTDRSMHLKTLCLGNVNLKLLTNITFLFLWCNNLITFFLHLSYTQKKESADRRVLKFAALR